MTDEVEKFLFCLMNFYDISHKNRLFLSNISKIVKGKKVFQVHLEHYHSELYEDPVVAIREFLKLKKKHFNK